MADEQFLRTTSGKIQRTALQKAFLAGRYAAAATALDLALGTAPLAAPDFFAAPAWVRKQPAAPSQAGPTLGKVVWIAPSELHAPLRAAWAAEVARRSVGGVARAAPGAGLFFDGGGWEEVRAVVRGGGVSLIVHALMLARPGGGEAAAAAAGGAGSTLCGLASAGGAAAGGERRLRVVCLRAPPPPPDPAADRLAFAAAGGALAPGVLKALAAEHAAVVERAAAVEVPAGAAAEQLVEVALCEAERGSALDLEVDYSPSPPSPPSPPSSSVPPPLSRRVKRFTSVGGALEAEATAGRRAVAPLLSSGTADGAAGGGVLVSGGLGGVGEAVVRLVLAERPAARVLVVGRRSVEAAAAQLEALGWGGAGSRVQYVSLDLGGSGTQPELEAAIAAFCCPPAASAAPLGLACVLHLAGSYGRAPLDGLPPAALLAATQAKVAGAVQLHEACATLGQRPAFVHFGSTATVFGGAGLGAYASWMKVRTPQRSSSHLGGSPSPQELASGRPTSRGVAACNHQVRGRERLPRVVRSVAARRVRAARALPRVDCVSSGLPSERAATRVRCPRCGVPRGERPAALLPPRQVGRRHL